MYQLMIVIVVLSTFGLIVHVGQIVVNHIKLNKLRSALRQCSVAMDMCEGEHKGNLRLFSYEAVQGIWDHAKEHAAEVLQER